MLFCFFWGGIGGCQKLLGWVEKFVLFMVDVLKSVFILVKLIVVFIMEFCCVVNYFMYDWVYKGLVSFFIMII